MNVENLLDLDESRNCKGSECQEIASRWVTHDSEKDSEEQELDHVARNWINIKNL